MNRRQKIIVSVTGIFLVSLLLVGLTYAYFLTRINGNENTKSISVSTANLALVYGDGNGILEVGEVLVPGDTVKFKTASGDTVDKKTFTVTNEGNATTDYVVVIDNVSVTYTSTVQIDGVTYTAGDTTTFESNDFVYTLTCTSGCNGVDTPTTFPINGGILVGNSIDVDEEQTYELSMTYLETGVDQSNDMNKTLTARVNIKDISTLNPYGDNTNTLAYNIINNAIVGATGTTLAATPITNVAAEISTYDTPGQYSYETKTTDSLCSGYDPWLVGDTSSAAQSGSTVSSYDMAVGKYVYDQCDGWTKYLDSYDSTTSTLTFRSEQTHEKTLSVTQDDYGTSYYYRGAVEDNYVEFNNMCWRIVRIEGDGSVKITLAAQKKCSEITDTDTGGAFIGTGHYGYNYDYVTNSNSATSTSEKFISDYVNSPTDTETSMRAKFDAWLTSSGIDTSKLKKAEWCLGNTTDPYDTSTGALLTDSVNDLMYNSTSFYYDTYRRLYGTGTTAYATLRCDGNYETYESYIGILTTDEVVFAGGKAGTSNTNYYLTTNTNSYWWTLSPSYFDGDHDYAFVVYDNGYVDDNDVYNGGINLRPSIVLSTNTVITGGNGTQTNPYVVG